MRGLGVVAVLVALSAACIEPDVRHCPNDTICPIAKACSPLGGCVVPEQLTACSPPPADGKCTLPGGDAGGCYSGVCLPIGCGNGVLEADERCDDGNTTAGDGCSATCDSDERCGNGLVDLTRSEGCDCGDADLPAAQRPSACAGEPNGSQLGARCTASCQIVGCGDGVVAGLEDCDGSDLAAKQCTDVGFYGGTLGCQPSCKFDTSACVGRCGDGARNGPGGAELCDGPDLAGLDCTDFGFYNPAGLACNAVCGIDTNACTGRCNDGTYQTGFEACDPGEDSAALSARGLDCTDFGFYSAGGLTCGASCQFDTSACGGGRCGDGIVNGGEDCDAAALAGKTCSDFGYHAPGGLACRGNCTFDFSSCSQRCGDGIINGSEQCDGSVPGGTDCTDFGFYKASGLACNASCAFDTSACAQRCGDGTINGNEQCDGSVPAGYDCTDFGFYNAPGLQCTGCALDTSGCSQRCGDGVVQSVEDCDPQIAFSADCTDFGFYQPGGLVCTGACNFSTEACKEECGDGLVNGAEPCDGAPPAQYTCTSQPGWTGGQLSCARGCYDEFEHCHKLGFASEYAGTDGITYDVWGVRDELFAASAAGVAHTNGGAWSLTSTTPAAAIWGASVSEVYAVGAVLPGPTWNLRVYNGTAWTTMPGPVQSPVALNDIYGIGSGNAIAVGDAGTVLRYASGIWTKLATPIPTNVTLRGVWASGPNDIFVVGDDGTRWHYTGAWNDQSVATTVDFTGIWGRNLNEAYAVANDGTVVRWNGAAWTSLGTTNVALTGIAGLPGSDVTVVSGYNATSNRGYIFQLGAGSWWAVGPAIMPRAFGVGGSDSKIAVAADGAIFTSDGASMIPTGLIPFPEAQYPVAGWGDSSSNMWLAGYNGQGADSISHFTGGGWFQDTSPHAGQLWAIYGGSGWLVAVGPSGYILASNGGGSWSQEAVGLTSQSLSAVWGDSANVYAAGSGGVILRRAAAGGAWTFESGTGTQSFNTIHGVPGGPVFAAGSAGILTKVGSTWSTMTTPLGAGATFSSIYARSASDVYALAQSGAAFYTLHYNGATWTAMPRDPTAGLKTISGTRKQVFANSSSGLYEWIGGRWLPMRLPGAFAGVLSITGVGDSLLIVRDSTDPLHLIGQTWTPTKAETGCSDSWDDDDDGLTDCADDDCMDAAACSSTGVCRPLAKGLTCGQMYTGTTVGGSTRWPYYGFGCGARDESGPEVYFVVTRPTSGPINLALHANGGANVDLIVPQLTATGACVADQGCIAAVATPDAPVENATINATGGATYVLIVDGYQGAAGSFQLDVGCP